MKSRPYMPFLIAGAALLPGTAVRLLGLQFVPFEMVLLSGSAILGASFILLWACDAAQSDISQALALAVVALMAVLPEYAVDMYFTWMAGRHPDTQYAGYAIDNMTGANRLLIGIGWGAIAALCWFRHRRIVRVGLERRMELFFLGLATAYAFIIPLKGSLVWYDGIVFLALYGWYIGLASKRPCLDCEPEGPAELLNRLPKGRRRVATALLFLAAGAAILANAGPFCEGLIGTGKALGINEFFLVQWLAPIASEAPEFVVALAFAWRGQASLALGSLLSSKLNQWTLLVGMIPGVFAISHGSLDHPLPMGQFQMREIMLTAAQSLLAVVMLSSMRLTVTGSLLLFGLFSGQLVMPAIVAAFPSLAMGMPPEQVHLFFSVLYVTAAVALFLQRPAQLWKLSKGLHVEPAQQRFEVKETAGREEVFANDPLRGIKTPHCARCPWRVSGIRAVQSEINVDDSR